MEQDHNKRKDVVSIISVLSINSKEWKQREENKKEVASDNCHRTDAVFLRQRK